MNTAVTKSPARALPTESSWGHIPGIAIEGTPSVVASFGLGLDSSAMLLRWMLDPSSRDFELDELVVITAMTGNEFASTCEVVTGRILPLFAQHCVRFVQVARSQRKTTASGDGVVVLDDSRQPRLLRSEGAYTLANEMLSAGTVPQRGGMRACSVHSKGNALDPTIARLTKGQPYRHAIGFEANEKARAVKDSTYNTRLRQGFYPLQHWGWSRKDCHEFVMDVLGEAIPKSACVFCPFAMSSDVGRSSLIQRYRNEPQAAATAMYLEHISRSLNTSQTLIEGSSVAELISTAHLDEAIMLYDNMLDGNWSVYEVRRVNRAGRAGKRGITARSVRVLATGTRTQMASLLASQPGQRRTGPDRITRHVLRERAIDGVDHVIVSAPAGVDAKQRPGFEEWWQDVVGDGLF
jgi:hypothetical protein